MSLAEKFPCAFQLTFQNGRPEPESHEYENQSESQDLKGNIPADMLPQRFACLGFPHIGQSQKDTLRHFCEDKNAL